MPPRGDSAIVRDFNLLGIDFFGADTLEPIPNGCREGDRLRRGDPMRLMMIAISLLCAVGCGMSAEAAAAKDRESSKATWALVLRVDGADVRIPLKVMNVLLFKDEEYAKQNPSVFQIEGSGVHLIGEIAAADNVDYGEHWERLVSKMLTIKASGEFHRDPVDSTITLPGAPEIAVTGGTMFVEKYTGKWSGRGRPRLRRPAARARCGLRAEPCAPPWSTARRRSRAARRRDVPAARRNVRPRDCAAGRTCPRPR